MREPTLETAAEQQTPPGSPASAPQRPGAKGKGAPREQQQRRAPVQGIAIEVLEGREAFVGLEREWNAALAAGPRDEPMLRHEWVRAWIENFAAAQPLRTFLVRIDGALQAALPLLETSERSADTCFLPMTTWGLPANDHSQRGGMLLGPRWEEALPQLFVRLAAETGWDRLRLRDLPEGAPEWRLRALAENQGMPCGLWVSLHSPYLPLPDLQPAAASGTAPAKQGANRKGQQKNDPGNARQEAATEPRFAIIESRLDAKFRANLRRRRRKLEEKGKLEYVLLDGKDAAKLDLGLADFFDIEGSGWKGRGGSAIAQRPELVGFYTQLARDAARRGALALGFLEHGGRRIAGHLSLIHAGRAFLLKLGYDESLREFSPGQQLAAEAIKDACARGLREFDFLGPDMEWKQDWETGFRTHTWLTIFRATRKGRLVHDARFLAWPVTRSLLGRARKGGSALAARIGARLGRRES